MRSACLILGALLLTGAGWLSPARATLPDQARSLVRPILLPILWQGLESAQRDGSPEEYAALGRVLMKFLPHWTDGYVHIASQLAFEASLAQKDPGAALDRVMAALAYLDDTPPLTASARESLLRNQARFLYIRCSQDPELARVFRERTGISPAEWSTGRLRQIPRLANSRFLQAELCFSVIEGLAIDIRLGEPTDKLLATLDTGVRLLDAVKDQELASAWRASLRNLRSYLLSPDEEKRKALATDPLLREIVAALRSR